MSNLLTLTTVTVFRDFHRLREIASFALIECVCVTLMHHAHTKFEILERFLTGLHLSINVACEPRLAAIVEPFIQRSDKIFERLFSLKFLCYFTQASCD
jgi:hypothetical protein